MTTPASTFAEALEAMGAEPRRDRSGPWWSARCAHPDHQDDTPSMRFRDGERALIVTCFGCSPNGHKPQWLREVMQAVDERRQLPPASRSRRATGIRGQASGTRHREYAYVDEQGTVIARHVRYRDPKGFSWESPFGEHWKSSLPARTSAHDLPLYRLPDILELPAGSSVAVCEGERDADNVTAAGLPATCSPAGSAGPPRDLSALEGMHVLVLVDNDEPGIKSALKWGDALEGVAASVTYWRGLIRSKGADVSDHLEAGHGLEDLAQLDRRGDRLAPPGGPEQEPEAALVGTGGIGRSAGAPALDQGKFRSVPVGRRFAEEHLLGRWIHVDRIGWHRWDGRRWEPVAEDHVMAEAATWLHSWLAGLLTSASADDIKYCLRYRDVNNVRAVVAGARTEPRILVEADRLDAEPGLLNCRNGVVDLRSGALLAHDPQRLITKVAPVDYSPSALHGDWDAALGALPPEAVEYLQLMVGQAATGEHDRGDPTTFHHGSGANGKSTVLATICAVLGGYAVTVPDSLLTGRPDSHPTDLMTLRGARFAVLEELPEDHLLPVARLKKIVDTPTMTARLIGRDFVTWRPTHHLAVSTNYHPVVSETDHGTWRRLVMIGYGRTFTGRNADPTLKARLREKAQQEAVLSWVVAGAKAWYASGRQVPAPTGPVADATEDWRQAHDPIGSWLADRVEPTRERSDRIPTVELHRRFTDEMGPESRPWSLTKFSGRLKTHQQVVEKYLGVDRGHRNQEPMALAGAAWKSGAQGAQAHPRGSIETPSRENLWDDPAHPAHERGTGRACTDCGGPVRAGYVRCDDCRRTMTATRTGSGS